MMTVLLIVLALILVAAMVLAVELLRPESVTEQGLAALNQSLTGGRDYERMAPWLDELSTEQGPIMRRQLKRLRGEFLTAWAVCRLLGPISQKPEPAPQLFGCWLKFHWLFAVIWVKTYGGHRAQAAGQVDRLLAVFGKLRRNATALMQFDAGLTASGIRRNA